MIPQLYPLSVAIVLAADVLQYSGCMPLYNYPRYTVAHDLEPTRGVGTRVARLVVFLLCCPQRKGK